MVWYSLILIGVDMKSKLIMSLACVPMIMACNGYADVFSSLKDNERGCSD